jgi:hypothetical protein
VECCRYTDFLVNEILPSGQVLHLRSLKVPGQSGQAGYTQKRYTETVQTDASATAANQSSSSTAATSTSPDELQKERADAVTAWGRLPAQLAEEDARHRKKQLEEYAAYKARKGLLDPQSDTIKYDNEGSPVSNADIHGVKSPKPSSVPEQETLTSSPNKDVAKALDLQEEIPKCKNRENLESTDKVVAGSPIAGVETGDKNGFQVCFLLPRHYSLRVLRCYP